MTRDIRLKLNLDSRDAQRDIKNTVKELSEISDEMEDAESAGKKMARAIEQNAKRSERELESATRAADALEEALGDVDNIDTRRAVQQLHRLGLTSEEIEADAEALADALRKVDDVELRSVDAGFKEVKRSSGEAADETDRVRQRGEGLQSALPAIRGFGDELGGTAYGAGIASQAVADLGDFALITGERFAQEGGRMSSVATKLGTVLGAAGLAGAFGGIAVQLGQSLAPAIKRFIGSQDEMNEATTQATERLAEQLGTVTDLAEKFDDFDGAPIAETLLGGLEGDDLAKLNRNLAALDLTYDDLFAALESGDGTITNLSRSLIAANDDVAAFAGEIGKTPAEIAEAITATDNFNALILELAGGNTILREQLAKDDGFRELVKNLEGVEDSFDDIDLNGAITQELADVTVAGGETAEELARLRREMPEASDIEIFGHLARYVSEVEAAADDAATATDDAAVAAGELAAAEDEAAAAADRAAEALRRQAGQLQAGADAMRNKIDATFAAADSTFAVRDADDAYASTLDAVAEKLKEAGDNDRERQQVLDGVAESAARLATAELVRAEETAAMSGEVLTATERQDALNESLINSAATAEGEARDAVLDYIAAVNDVPDNAMTEIEAALQDGDIETANRLLAEASRTREATIIADANTAAAEAKLDQAARTRNVLFRVNAPGGGQVPNWYAKGTQGAPPGWSWVGEQGPELMNLPAGTVVRDAERSQQMAQGPNRGGNVYMTFTAPMRPDDIAELQRRADRRNGRL